jgi:hypothetical protein
MAPPTDDELAVLAAMSLADSAFLLAEPSPRMARWQDEWVCAVVPFDAAVPGRLVLAAPAAVAAQVAADALCVAPTDDEAILHAGVVVAALATAVAGTVLAEIFKKTRRPRIGRASVVPSEPPLSPGERARRVTLVNEVGQPLRVELVLTDAA